MPSKKKAVKLVRPIQWTGSNYAAVKQLHPKARHYPKSDQPDVLHLDTPEGHTLLVRKGQWIRQQQGRVHVAANPED